MHAPEEITSERLRLRMPRMEDAPEVFAYAADPHVVHHLSIEPAVELADCEAFIDDRLRAWKDGEAHAWAVTVIPDDTLVGIIEARPSAHGVELGYVLDRAHWGNGYMTEAVRTVAELALDDPDVYRVWAYVDVDNEESHHVLERAGFTEEGTLHRYAVHPNVSSEPRDALLFARWR